MSQLSKSVKLLTSCHLICMCRRSKWTSSDRLFIENYKQMILEAETHANICASHNVFLDEMEMVAARSCADESYAHHVTVDRPSNFDVPSAHRSVADWRLICERNDEQEEHVDAFPVLFNLRHVDVRELAESTTMCSEDDDNYYHNTKYHHHHRHHHHHHHQQYPHHNHHHHYPGDHHRFVDDASRVSSDDLNSHSSLYNEPDLSSICRTPDRHSENFPQSAGGRTIRGDCSYGEAAGRATAAGRAESGQINSKLDGSHRERYMSSSISSSYYRASQADIEEVRRASSASSSAPSPQHDQVSSRPSFSPISVSSRQLRSPVVFISAAEVHSHHNLSASVSCLTSQHVPYADDDSVAV